MTDDQCRKLCTYALTEANQLRAAALCEDDSDVSELLYCWAHAVRTVALDHLKRLSKP